MGFMKYPVHSANFTPLDFFKGMLKRQSLCNECCNTHWVWKQLLNSDGYKYHYIMFFDVWYSTDSRMCVVCGDWMTVSKQTLIKQMMSIYTFYYILKIKCIHTGLSENIWPKFKGELEGTQIEEFSVQCVFGNAACRW